MARVYSTQLAAGEYALTGTKVLGAVPSGVIWVLKSAIVSNPLSTDAPQFFLYAVVPAGNVDVMRYPALAQRTAVSWQGMAVLNPGDSLRIYCSSATLRIFVSGYVLTVGG